MRIFLRLLATTLICALFGALTFIAFDTHHPILGTLAIFLGMASLFIWLKDKFLSYRFLYPGMLCFLLFTILPILFTILISFTNLGTGHFFSAAQVEEILLSEKEINAHAQEEFFELRHISGENYLIKSQSTPALYAQFALSQKEVLLSPELPSTQTLQNPALTNAEVFKIFAQLRLIDFRTPSGVLLRYHRTDLLMSTVPTYESFDHGRELKHLASSEVFVRNDKSGFYESQNDGRKLLPGFYTVVGFSNYWDLLTKDDFKETFLKVSTWTLIWALASVALTFSLGMSLALFLNDKNLKLKSVYRNLLILPYSIPFFISVLVFKGMLSKDFGVINSGLTSLGFSPIPWLEDALWAKVSCLMVNLWLGFPYMFLITTGILQSIPASVYEAAKIDGAGRWQAFKNITLPMILSSVTPLLIGSFAFNMGNFVGIYLLTGGGPAMLGATTPAGETDILISYTYRLAFEGASGQNFGLASSIALFIFIIITILTILNFKIFSVNKNESSKA